MFFSLERGTNNRFPNQYQLGTLTLNTDNGWNVLDKNDCVYIFKGYADDYPLEQIIKKGLKSVTGNYCVIEYNKNLQNIEISTDKWRQFTMYYDTGKRLSNFYINDTTIWADASVKCDLNLEIELTVIDLVGSFSQEQLSYNTVLDTSYNTIYSKVKNFLGHNKLPIKVFLSGGVDSALVFSFINKLTNNYSHVLSHEIHWDYFWVKNFDHLVKNFWGYTQIHHWLEPCVLSSGAPGDEYFLRNPQTIDIWLSWHGINPLDYFTDNVRYNQKKYFEKSLKKFEADKQYQTFKKELMQYNKNELLSYLCHNVLNDSQHWHLGNTITFTPLRDFNIFKSLIQLDPEDLRNHINGGQFSIDLINRNDPKIVDYLSTEKNVSESYENLHSLLTSS